jgi:ubiquinone/menaquinone biosynthesis C-methylase UbiE
MHRPHNLPFNPLIALTDENLFDLFLRMLSHRYRTDILIDHYQLDVPMRMTWWGKKISPEEKARKELEFLRDRVLNHELAVIVEDFWMKLRPQGDHLRDHLETEGKYNQIAVQASDLKLIKPLFYLFPHHQALDIADIGAGRNRLGHAIKKQFDDLSVANLNWRNHLGGNPVDPKDSRQHHLGVSHADPKVVRITGVDVTDWTDPAESPGVVYHLMPTPTQIDIEDSSQNVVITKWCFHHMTMEQMERQIENIFRILRPGGVVIVIEAFATSRKSLPTQKPNERESTFSQQLLEVSRRIEFADIWPEGPWKEQCYKISTDYLELSFADQIKILALEDYIGHLVLNRREHMPFTFKYLPAEQIIANFVAHGFEEQRWNFLLFGHAPIIRRGPTSARFMFQKPPH